MKRLLVLLLVAAVCLPAMSKVRLPGIISDHMVLQRNSSVHIWGWTDPGKTVRVKCSWNGRTSSARSEADGSWTVTVDTPDAGGPYDISISDGQTVNISDVMVGEVWICSGQSNMEMPLEGFDLGQYVQGAGEYISRANPSKPLRMIQLPLEYSLTPKEEVNAEWCTHDPAILPKMSAIAVYFGDILQQTLSVPVGLVITDWGASTIEAWMDKSSIQTAVPGKDISLPEKESDISNYPQQVPTVLYNAMVHPLRHFGIKGMIWYQGESNIANYSSYAALQKEMVALWRRTFNNPDMPFCYVQIAPFDYPYQTKDKNAAYLREQQAICQDIINNSAMAVTIDLGQKDVIHPCRKMEVADRLSRAALALAYDRKIEFRSPEYISHKTEGSTVFVRVSRAVEGLHCDIAFGQPVPGFEVAGEDRRFYPATAVLISSKDGEVALSSPHVPHPVAVRYCFKDYQPGILYNNLGLPLAPFRTDDWTEVKGPVFLW